MSDYCEHIIGVLNYNDGYDLATVDEVKQSVKYRKRLNKYMDENYGSVNHLWKLKEWTLEDYFDKRKSTNLTRFDYCPRCGEKIDWRKLKNER